MRKKEFFIWVGVFSVFIVVQGAAWAKTETCTEIKQKLDNDKIKLAELQERQAFYGRVIQQIKDNQKEIRKQRKRLNCEGVSDLDGTSEERGSILKLCQASGAEKVANERELSSNKESLSHNESQINRIKKDLEWGTSRHNRRCAGTKAQPPIQAAQCNKGYEKKDNQAIILHNRATLKNMTPEACMKKCDETIWCKSFDFGKKTDICFLSDKNSQDVESSEDVKWAGKPAGFSKWNYDYYEKQCRG